MAKDGTVRGGARPGAGKKRKALSEKILEGKAAASIDVPELKVESDINGNDMPPVSEYMQARQKNGIPIKAKEVYERTWAFLKTCGCELKVSKNLLEHYSMNYARWIQCEEAISQFGLLAKHPTTGSAMASPYVQMSREYSKQANQIWYQISQIIRENSETYVDTQRIQSDTMEDLLLNGRKRKRA